MAGDLPFEESLVVLGGEEAEAGLAPEEVAESGGRVLHVYGDRVSVVTPSLDPTANVAAAPPTEISDDLLARARSERGLPPVAYWDPAADEAQRVEATG